MTMRHLPFLLQAAAPSDDSTWDEIEDWARHEGVDVLIIIGVLLAAYIVFRSIFPRVARAAMMRDAHPPDQEMRRRVETILGVIDGSARIFVFALAVITILPVFGVNITAIVTGLGITGLALALGSQQLVRDTLNGIFLLAEDQFRTGDVVTIAGRTGTVESISLRRTIIRDEDGVVHSVPNGSIDVVSNLTRDFARVRVEVRVAYGEDLEKVKRIVEEVGAAAMADPALKGAITEAPKVLRLESVDDAGVTMTVSARTKPEARWEVTSELRGRLAKEFLREGVHVPFATLQAPGQDDPTPSGESGSTPA